MACHLDPVTLKAAPGLNEHWYRPAIRSAYCTTHDIRKYWMCLRPRTRPTPEDARGDESGDNDDIDAPLHGIAAGLQVRWNFCLRLIYEETDSAWNGWMRNWMGC